MALTSQTTALDRSRMIGSHAEFAQRRLQNIGFRRSQSNDAMRRKRSETFRKRQTNCCPSLKVDDGDERVGMSLAGGGKFQQILSRAARADPDAQLGKLSLKCWCPAGAALKNNDLWFGHRRFTQQGGSLGPCYSSSKFMPRRT